MFPRLVLKPWPQVICLPRPPKVLRLSTFMCHHIFSHFLHGHLIFFIRIFCLKDIALNVKGRLTQSIINYVSPGYLALCWTLHFGRPRQVDHLRSGVRDQPDQHEETPSLLKIQKISQAWLRQENHLDLGDGGCIKLRLCHCTQPGQQTAQIKNLMSQLGTKQDSTKLQENLQQLQHSTNQLAKETNELLKELGSLPLPLSTSEQRQQRLQKERLMNDFSAALNNFQAVQRRVSEKEKESIARARAGSRLSAEERQREEQLVSFDSHEEWNQMQSQEDEVAITEQDLELIKERETAIRQLEADILDVNQIFKDLAMMIHDQGDLIDSIEANVESSEVHVERATEQLQRAAYYQKKSRKKMCILVLVLSVIVVILGLIIWLVYKTK
ncbi:Syntaxin-12 [Plecturocebus cupreus]